MSDSMFEGLVQEFIQESRERIERIEETLLGLAERAAGERQEAINIAKRELHTLKGNSGMMEFRVLQQRSHRLEDMVVVLSIDAPDVEEILKGLDELRRLLDNVAANGTDVIEQAGTAPTAAAPVQAQAAPVDEATQGSVRVSFQSLDELVDLLAEMVIFRNRLADSISKGRNHDGSMDDVWNDIEGAQTDLGKALGFIRDRIMLLRMVPLQTLFKRLKRIVHDESLREGKSVEFEVAGGETPLDKALLEVANQALGHLVRNSVIHGLERPDERVARGKRPEGIVRISAQMRSGEVLIDVADDGRGINEERLIEKATQLGIDISGFENVFDLMFLPGVTTKDSADIGAGRGIGLSAVVEAAQRLGGRIEVASKRNVGTRFRLRLPLNVSITSALIFETDGEEYALPLQYIVESLHFKGSEGHNINNAGVYRWRDEVLPILDIGHVTGTSQGIRDKGYVIIVESDRKLRGLVVDAVKGIRDIVVKAMDADVAAPKWVAGATIRGDGKTIMILDAAALMNIKPFLADTSNQEVIHVQ